MERALLVGAKADGVLGALLCEASGLPIVCAADAAEARALLDEDEIALWMVVPASDDEPAAAALALDAARHTTAGVLYLCREERGAADERLPHVGVQLVSRPVSRAAFVQAVHDALTVRSRLRTMHSENRQLQYKLDETRMVSRAKATLMQYLAMTEPQTHRYIEKQAMDLRTTRIEIAKNIMKNYGL